MFDRASVRALSCEANPTKLVTSHNFDFDKWSEDLSVAIANALKEFRPKIDDVIAIFALDCHPWNGVFVCAI